MARWLAKRITRAFVALVAFVAGLVVLPRRADALNIFITKGASAPAMYTHYLSLTSGTRHHYRTHSSYPVDPVMHLWNDTSHKQAAMNDDYAPPDRNSRIDWTATVTTTYHLIVRTYSNSSWGDGSVDQCIGSDTYCATDSNWTSLGSAHFAGYINSNVFYSSYGVADYWTTRVWGDSGGTDDTVLLALDSTGKLLAYDDDSGVALMSRISYVNYLGGDLAQVNSLVTGAYSTTGTTNTVANDISPDSDGDGLGYGLENALGTCDSTSTFSYCAGRASYRLVDSDLDGLSDGAETFGVVNPTNENGASLHFPAWGADPLRKDIFIEQDYIVDPACSGSCLDGSGNVTWGDCWDPGSDSTGNPFTEAVATAAQAEYSTGLQNEVLNIAGDGIMLHFDTGFTCSNHSLCGAWGGGGNSVVEPDHDGGSARVEDPFRHTGPGNSTNPTAYFKYLQLRPTAGTARCTTPTIKTAHV